MAKETYATSKETNSTKLAIHGGHPVRTEPLPLEFPGIHPMGKEEIEAAVQVLESRSLFRYYGIDLQKETATFETEFASFLGTRHCVAVTSGTGALHVAMAALGVGPGQEVIVPAYMWVSAIAAVVDLGAIPVLADIDDSFTLDPRKLEEKITPRTSGVVLVHMSGAPGDAEAIAAIALKHNIFLLEDCAQCAGGSIHGRKVGTFGDMGIFSFQMNKNMTSGEGGAVVTANDDLYDRAVASHDTGYARDASGRAMLDRKGFQLWGRGYRVDEIRAAILRVQLRKLPHTIERMHASKYRIRRALERFPQVKLRRIVDPAGDTGCFLITTYNSPRMAREVTKALRAEGIVTFPQGVSNVVLTDWGLHIYSNIPSLVHKTGVDPANAPWSLQENRESHWEYNKGACPQADRLFETSSILDIPSCLTRQDEDDIIGAFEKVLSSAEFAAPAEAEHAHSA